MLVRAAYPEEISVTTPPMGRRLVCFLCTLFAAALAANASPTPSDIPEGTLGWTVQDYSHPGFSYAADPVEACRRMRLIGVTGTFNGSLVGIQAWTQPWWQGDNYECQYVDAWGRRMNWTTSLKCEAGYTARWPGLCMPTWSSLAPAASCSSRDAGFSIAGGVMASTGHKVQREVDFAPAPGGMLEVVRHYRSVPVRRREPLLTEHWAFSFERDFSTASALPGMPPTEASIAAGDGSVVVFRRLSNGTWTAGKLDATLSVSPAFDEWFYRSPAGTLERYVRVAGRLRVASVHGHTGVGISYAYDAAGRLVRITDSFGRELVLHWGGRWVESIDTPQGTLRYDTEAFEPLTGSTLWERSRLVAATRFDNAGNPLDTRQYHYGAGWFDAGMLTGITDELGVRFTTSTYDGSGRVNMTEYAGGVGRHAFSYPPGATIVDDPLGAQRTYSVAVTYDARRVVATSHPGDADCAPAARKFTHSSYGVLTSSEDFNGNKTCYRHDPARTLETSRLEGLAAGDTCPYSGMPKDPSQRLTQFRWHPHWPLQVRVAGPLLITTYVYNGEKDLDGTSLSCADGATLPDGSPLAVPCKKIEQPTTDANGAAGFSATPSGPPRVTTYTYNEAGQMLTQEVAGAVTRREYYADSAATHTRGDLRSVTNAVGHVREYLDYTPAGRALLVREPGGQFTRIDYDPRGQAVAVTENAGTPGELRTRVNYDAAGQATALGTADGALASYAYDPAHRLVQVTDGDGNTVRYTLDNAGNRVQEEVADATGRPVRRIVRSFDMFGRLESVAGEQP